MDHWIGVGGDEQKQVDGEDSFGFENRNFGGRNEWCGRVGLVVGGLPGWGRWALAKPLSMTLERPLSISKGPLSLTKA